MRAISAISLTCLAVFSAPAAQTDDWPCYGHDAGCMRYSPLPHVNRENVSRLTLAWVKPDTAATPSELRRMKCARTWKPTNDRTSSAFHIYPFWSF